MPSSQVDWDLSTISFHIDLITKLLTIYLLASWLALLTQIGRWWVILRLCTSANTHQFEAALRAIHASDWPALRAVGIRFKKWSLHCGLREWAHLPDSAAPGASQAVVVEASKRFRVAWNHESTSVANLLSWISATKLALAIFGATEITVLLEQVARFKSFGISFVSGNLANITRFWAVGLWLILAMYLAHWYFSRRLLRQRSHWRDFLRATHDSPN